SIDKRLDQLSITALRYIAHLTKVRGYKVIVRLLPHHVSYLDKLLTVLEQYKTTVGSDLFERHVLLLWLWIVCKNPFDFRRFDPVDQPGTTTSRILAVATSYLKYPWSTVHSFAQCLARHDCIPLIPSIISECADHLKNNSENLLSYAVLICAILKHVYRTTSLYSLVPSVAEVMIHQLSIEKVEQGIRLIKEVRGRRRLEENLKSPKANGSEFVTQHCSNNNNLGADDICMEEDEMIDSGVKWFICPLGLIYDARFVEWAIGNVLCALSDDHTTVRWSAAKGVGRITARLPKELAVQVVDSILSSNFHRLAGHCSWHGGCLALAELSRRGFLLPEALDRAFPIVQQALFYEEPMGRHAFGSNVRDAACYVLWAFARAYEPDELKTFIDSVATSLMCVALFDREVNLRRAASAAFQENVGRQANFPDGIALLTTVDYFTVGNRWRCYTKACLEVVRFPKYADAIIDHLVESKIHRHGYLLALSHCIQGLLSAGFSCSKEVLSPAIELPWKLRAESEKLKISGGELTRLALATYIRCLSSVPIALDPETIEKWQDRLLMFACDDTAAVRSAAAAAASAFFPAYFSERLSMSIDAKIESIPTKILTAKKENERIGLGLVVAFLPRRFISSLLVDAICTVIVK
ncbi:HEAT repeat protein, partial [Ostertagia ostertagi]